jgi:hypothetical protein
MLTQTMSGDTAAGRRTSMMSTSGGLKPRAVAGGPSVTRFTHSSCTGMRPSGKPSAAVRKMDTTSPMLLLIM